MAFRDELLAAIFRKSVPLEFVTLWDFHVRRGTQIQGSTTSFLANIVDPFGHFRLDCVLTFENGERD